MCHLTGSARQAVAAALFASIAGCGKSAEPDAYGHIEATEVVVAPQASGRLQWLATSEGQRLQRDAIVGVVDTTALSLQLDQVAAQRSASASRVEEASRQIGVLEAQRAIAERSYARTRRLYAAQAATAQQLDQAERDLRTLVAQIAAARAQRDAAAKDASSTDARVAQVRDQLAKSRVVNPLRGTVLTVYSRAGEFVQIGQPLYKIANLDTMELRAYVTEPQLPYVKLGQPAQVTIDLGDKGGGHRTLTGTIGWVAAQAEFTPTPIQTRDERTNLVYAVKVRVPNPQGTLKIGMPADVTFPALTASR